MYMMSRDHISMHIDSASLQLMLQLLSVDRALQTQTKSGGCTGAGEDDELARLQHRLLDIVNQSVAHASVTLDNMTVSMSVVCTYIHKEY